MELELTQDAVMVTAPNFDYSQIDEGIRDEVQQAAKNIRSYGIAFRGSVIQIGRRLIEVKGILPHGQFGEWLDGEFAMSDRMARNFMNVAHEYEGKTEIFPFLSDTILYMLAAPSYPEEARAEVEQAATSGQKITVGFAKEAAQKRTVERIRRPVPPPTVTPAKVVYTEPKVEAAPKPDDETIDLLLTADAHGDAFKAALLNATISQLEIAFWKVPKDDKWRATKIGNRHQLIRSVQAVDDMTDALAGAMAQLEAPATVACVPEALVTAGYSLEQLENGLWRWRHQWPNDHVHVGHPNESQADALAQAEEDYARRVEMKQIETLAAPVPSPMPEPPPPDEIPTVEELEAIAEVSLEEAGEDEERAERDLSRASYERAPAIEVAQPDPRIAEAQRLIDALEIARNLTRADYHRLTGCDTDTLAYMRDSATMLQRLQNLVDILTKKGES